jgi:coatomer subunit beta'
MELMLVAMQALCSQARAAGKTNVAFMAAFLLQDLDTCLDTLVASNRLPEAAFFARTYRPSRAAEMLRLWQKDLREVNVKAAESLASPEEYPNLFPDWDVALKVEQEQMAVRAAGARLARVYVSMEEAVSRDLISQVRFLPDISSQSFKRGEEEDLGVIRTF